MGYYDGFFLLEWGMLTDEGNDGDCADVLSHPGLTKTAQELQRYRRCITSKDSYLRCTKKHGRIRDGLVVRVLTLTNWHILRLRALYWGGARKHFYFIILQ